MLTLRSGSLRSAALVALAAAGIGCSVVVDSITGGTTGGGGSGGAGAGGSKAASGAAGPGGSGGGSHVCGNGILEPGEACDDGNSADGDACSSACVPTEWSLTPGETNAMLPDVAATSHDGGAGFLVVWYDEGPMLGLTGTPVSAKGAFGPSTWISPANYTPGVVALPDGRALAGARYNGPSVGFAIVDPSSLALLEQNNVGLSTNAGTYNLELAASASGRVLTLNRGTWNEAIQSTEVTACVVTPDGGPCFTLAPSNVAADPSLVADGDELVAAIPVDGGFDLVRLDAVAPIGTTHLALPSSPSYSDLARRPEGFVLAWEAPDEGCLFFQPFDAALNPLKPLQPVPGTCGKKAHRPRVATSANGRFVISYATDGVDCGVWAVVSEPDGTPGAPLRVNDEQDSCSQESIAANPAGDVLFVWERNVGITRSISAKLIPRLLE